MITAEKIREVRKSLKNGVPEGEIRESLRDEGYSPSEIEQAFAARPYDMRGWYLFFGTILALGGLWSYAQTGNLLLLILSGLLFLAYFNEIKRLKRSSGSAPKT